MKYEVTYTESYARTYVVEADSKDEAIDMVSEGIYGGQLKGPDNCYDSNYTVSIINKKEDN